VHIEMFKVNVIKDGVTATREESGPMSNLEEVLEVAALEAEDAFAVTVTSNSDPRRPNRFYLHTILK
jgi:hypothetical protein